MSMRIVMLGDIVGRPGRQAVAQQIPALRERFGPDLIIANAENAANGSGLTPDLYRKLKAAGIDGMTLGDHAFRKIQILPTLETEADIIRPINLPAGAAGKGLMRLTPGEGRPNVYVVTLLGQIFVNPVPNDPFAAIDAVLRSLPEKDPIIIVEMHAEATSEKAAMGWHLNGKVSAVIGSHTHVPTADACILPRTPEHGPVGGGTAFITDMGMCGPRDSVIGRRIDRVLHHMTTAMPAPFDVAEGDPRVSGVFLEIDESTHDATAIEHFELKANRNAPPFTAT